LSQASFNTRIGAGQAYFSTVAVEMSGAIAFQKYFLPAARNDSYAYLTFHLNVPFSATYEVKTQPKQVSR
jgi:hypothetical protein